MASPNTYANISAFVNTVYEQALLIARAQNVMQPLVTGFTDLTGKAVRSNQEYNASTFNQIEDTDDLASQAFTPSVLSTLTPAEFGAQFFVTDTRLESDPFPMQAQAAQELGASYSKTIDTALVSQFTNFTGGTLGAAGSVITWGHLFAMQARLVAQNAPAPYNVVIHPYQWNVLQKAASVAGTRTNAADSLMEGINRAYLVDMVAGLNIFVSNNLTPDGSDDVIIGMFSPAALALDVRRAFRLEPERDASRRGWELNASGMFAAGVWRPKFGIKATFDASLPTS
jgi:hypothetical protein